MPGDIDIYKIATFLSLCASLTYTNDAKISPRFIESSFPLFPLIHTYSHVSSITLLIKARDFYSKMSMKFLVENLGQAAQGLIFWDAQKIIDPLAFSFFQGFSPFWKESGFDQKSTLYGMSYIYCPITNVYVYDI